MEYAHIKGNKPVFSVIIPTKNRSFLVGYTIQSVLQQSFPDFEVILVDNDDTNLTNNVVGEFNDPRIRYFRTGTLSMADNWEFGIDQVRGDYVLLLEDKMVLKFQALQKIKEIIDIFPDYPICWRYDTYNEDLDWFTPSKGLTGEETVVNSDIIISSFFDCDFDFFNNNSPRGLNSCISRNIICKIKNGNLKRFFVPLSPDYTSAFQTLLNVDRVISLNDSLVIVGGLKYSGGNDAYLRGPIAQRFLKDNNINNDEDLYNQVPLKLYSLRNSLFNDMITLLNKLNNDIYKTLNMERYFLFIYDELMMVQSMGKDVSLEIRVWDQALEKLDSKSKEKILIQREDLTKNYDTKGLLIKKINEQLRFCGVRILSSISVVFQFFRKRNILYYTK